MADILTSDPRNVLALHYLGICLYAKGNKPRAEESFKAALSVDPLFAAAPSRWASCTRTRGSRTRPRRPTT